MIARDASSKIEAVVHTVTVAGVRLRAGEKRDQGGWVATIELHIII